MELVLKLLKNIKINYIQERKVQETVSTLSTKNYQLMKWRILKLSRRKNLIYLKVCNCLVLLQS